MRPGGPSSSSFSIQVSSFGVGRLPLPSHVYTHVKPPYPAGRTNQHASKQGRARRGMFPALGRRSMQHQHPSLLKEAYI